MTQDDPFARLEAGLAQPKPAKIEPPDDQQIIARTEAHFAELFDAIRKFDTILQRQGDWNARFSWLGVDSNQMPQGVLSIHKGGHAFRKVQMYFQAKGVWFNDPEFKKITHREKEHGGWNSNEVSEIKAALSTYIQHVVQTHG